jgi:hypothetical protein
MTDDADVTAAELRAFRGEIERIRAFLAKAPVMSPSIGFCPWIFALGPTGKADLGYALQARFQLNNGRAADYEFEEPTGLLTHDPAAEGDMTYRPAWPLAFRINTIPRGLGAGALDVSFAAKDGTGEFFTEPRPTHLFQGFPVYRRNLLVIARHDRPLYRPVRLDRVLAWKLAALTSRNNTGPADAPASETLRQRLASLTSAQAAAQACLATQSSANGPAFVDAASSECSQRIVEPNPDYYDHALPRTAVQLLTIDRFNVNAPPDESRPNGGRPSQYYLPLWANGHTMWGSDWQRYRQDVMSKQ